MPDLHIALTVPSWALWACITYLAAGLLVYPALLAWVNARISSPRRGPLHGLSILRWLASSVLWVPILVLERQDRRRSRLAVDQWGAQRSAA